MDVVSEPVELQAALLQGDLAVPNPVRALVLFAHDQAGSHLSERNRWMARALQRQGLATLLFDLLTPDEALLRRKVFDLQLLGQRLDEALQWVRQRPALAALPLCLFGTGTGAAAVLAAAAERPKGLAAVVCCGGRTDQASSRLVRVHAPTLLIVGGDDPALLDLNRWALRQLQCSKRLEVVPGARHQREEFGELQSMAALAADWFVQHLPAKAAP